MRNPLLFLAQPLIGNAREIQILLVLQRLFDQAEPYTGNRLVPLKGYPGIVWERPKSRNRPREVYHSEL